MDSDNHWVQVKLEENSRGSLEVLQLTGVVGYTILVGLKRRTSRSNISSWNHMQEVLIRHERYQLMSSSTKQEGTRPTFFGDLKGVVKRLSDIREVWTKRKLGDDMGQVHLLKIL